MAETAEVRSDADRLAEIELEWERYLRDYADDLNTGVLDYLPAGKVSGQFEFLVDRAKGSGAAAGTAAVRLRDIDKEWREYRFYNNKDVAADRRVPFAVGKLIRQAKFLCALARGQKPEDEPLYVVEDTGPARGPAAGGVVRGASWESRE